MIEKPAGATARKIEANEMIRVIQTDADHYRACARGASVQHAPALDHHADVLEAAADVLAWLRDHRDAGKLRVTK